MASCTIPNTLSGRRQPSARRRTQNEPAANPRMNADSISSKECVALPSTSASMRSQPIS